MASPPATAPYDLEGHVAVVTGANHGIGAATARLLAECGAGVLVSFLRVTDSPDSGLPEAYRRDRARGAEGVLEEIRSRGGRAIALEADLRREESPGRIFTRAEAELGPVDILIHNASGWVPDTFAEEGQHATGQWTGTVDAETFDQVFSVDARGGALLMAEFARRHRARQARWGRIVSLTSGAPQGFPGEVSYGAAKAALENYTLSAAVELGRFGVTANAVHPPITDTGWVTDAVRDQVERDPHLLHVAEPEDVAAVIAYLCSEASHLVTANVIHLR